MRDDQPNAVMRVKPLVIIESPYAGNGDDVERNTKYLGRVLRDSIMRGERPFASHAMYTLALNDNDPDERKLGMELGWQFLPSADLVAVYADLGISNGMRRGMERAILQGVPVEERTIAL